MNCFHSFFSFFRMDHLYRSEFKFTDSFFTFFFFFFLFMATPVAYGSSRARGQIGAAAVCLHYSHSNKDPSHICDLCHNFWEYRIFFILLNEFIAFIVVK